MARTVINVGPEVVAILADEDVAVTSLEVTSTTSSTSTSTGALTVDGGVGIAENLNVGGTVRLSSAGPAQLIIEADTDNNIEEDNASILFSQDGGNTSCYLGYPVGSNVFTIRQEANQSIAIEVDSLETVRFRKFSTDISITTTSTSTTTGALTVAGGVGIGENLNVGGTITGNGSGLTNVNAVSIDLTEVNDATNNFAFNIPFMTVDAGGATARVLQVDDNGITFNPFANLLNTGSLKLDSTASSTSTSTGALTVAGGVGIAENLNVGGAIAEGVYTNAAVGATFALDATLGPIQVLTLSASSTFSDSLASGQYLTLHITAGANLITWPTTSWVGGTEPTLNTSGESIVNLWKVGTTLYGDYVGDI